MEDSEVPIRWKIYATLTGFWIKGLTFFASNEWLEKELKISRRAIQYALGELEAMNLIKRDVKGYERIIMPGGCNRLHGGVQSSDQKGCKRLHHNSDSSSDNKKETSEEVSSPLEIVKDEGGRLPRPPKDKELVSLRNSMYETIEKEYGAKPTPNMGDYQRLLAAKKRGISPKDMKYMLEDAISKGKGRTVRSVFTDREIDLFNQENA